MVHKTIKMLGLLSVIFLAGCYYDVEEELYPDNGCASTNPSFASNVLPIIEANCYACHKTGSVISAVSLEGYDKLKIVAQNGSLLGTIKHAPGYSPMPQSGAKLSDCNISIIESWINNGIPNN